MIHITDGETGKILSFIPLGDFWNDIHSKSLKDNQETYDFTTFADRKYSEFLTDRNRVVIPDEDNNFIELIIENSREYRSNNALYTQVYTTASYLQLKKAKVIEPQTFKDQTISTIMAHTLAGTEFQAGILEGMGTRTFVVEDYTNPYAFINTIANEFSLEKRFRIVVNNNKVVARYVDLLKREGEWRGREVEFGKDLIGIERKEDNSNIVTALLGIGPEKEDGTRLTALVTDDEALQRWGRPDPDTGKLMHLIEPYEPTTSNSDMTLDELTQYTRTELDKRINTIVEYSGEVADLEHIPGLENKKIRFGDTIKIKDTKFKPPLYLEARVHTMERSLSDKSQKKVTLGDFIEYTEEDVKAIWKSLQSEINKKLTYIWVRYSQYPDGSGMTEDSTNASYMGVAITKTDAAPENPEDYTWTLIKGEKGEDGTSSYTHIAYADNETGTVGFTFTNTLSKAYIGMYVDSNPVASTDPTKYKWTLVKGADGSQGIPGPPGEDGRTPYFHVAYANNATGTVGFSTTDSTNKLYIGQYTDFISADSTDPTKYKWTLIKGEKGDPGPQGIQGPPGEDGQTLYTWIKYADTPTSGMSNLPNGKKYMGIAYNKTTPTESTNYADYTWTLVKGEPGIPGPPGEDGTTTYTWIKYADDDKGTGMSDSPDGKRYLGLAYNKTTPTESNNPSDYSWSPLYDNVIPGGKNYLRYSDFNTTHGWTAWNRSGTLSVASVPGFPNDLLNQTRDSEVPANSAIGVHNSSISEQGFSVVGGKDYTVSYYIRARGLVSMNYCYLLYNDDGSNQLLPTVKFEDCPIVKLNGYDYHYVTHYFKANRDGTGVRLLIGGRSDALYGLETTIPYFYLNRPQLEDGNVASPWGLAQKDVEEKIAQAEQNAKDASVGLGILYNGFKVTKEEGLEIALSNSLVRTIANATGGFKIQRRATTSSPWTDVYYADTNGRLYTIDGVFMGELRAATGTFGEVSVKDGDFILQDNNSNLGYSIASKTNHVQDHSFELVEQHDALPNSDDLKYSWDDMYFGFYPNTPWYITRGTPKLAVSFGPSGKGSMPIFGSKGVCVRSTDAMAQQIHTLSPSSVYALSFYAKRQWNVSAGAIPKVDIYHVDAAGTRLSLIASKTFTAVASDYSVERYGLTFTTPVFADNTEGIEIVLSGANANWAQIDGVQLIENDKPGLYDEEANVWKVANGQYDVLNKQRVLWNGVAFMNASTVITPDVPLQKCPNGWILVWSAYSSGAANNWNYVYTYIPKSRLGNHTLCTVPVDEADSNAFTIKALSITHTTITGVANNQSGINAQQAVLRQVLMY
ncbi:phage tail spike protein [Ureibacillus sp. 179-F W5.1 NHS]|uniref:phage tail spike protein n=1 Tax=Ureibacillus sp. 179-F W5.1 NHS TaxID=3374297 RepID=UPI00387930A0